MINKEKKQDLDEIDRKIRAVSLTCHFLAA
jgi:hypothetical protein